MAECRSVDGLHHQPYEKKAGFETLTSRGYEYNHKLFATQVSVHTGELPLEHSFYSSDAQNIVVTAVKKAEDEDALIVRFYEWAGKDGDVRLRVPAGASSTQLTNLMEKPEGAPLEVSHDEVVVPVQPFQIVTVKVTYPQRTLLRQTHVAALQWPTEGPGRTACATTPLSSLGTRSVHVGDGETFVFVRHRRRGASA